MSTGDATALGLDPQLLEILACPAPDHGSLRVGTPDDPAASALTCTVCDRRYPVSDGIPVMLLTEATHGPGDAAPRSSTPGPDDGPDGREQQGPAPSAAG